MPVLDVRRLSSEQLTRLAADYDALSREGLEPLAHLKTDPVRCQIDAAISHVLDICELLFIRELLEREPGFTGKDIVSRNVIEDDETAVDAEERNHPALF